jgi:CRISPR-associated endonuclease/helicase Cas3
LKTILHWDENNWHSLQDIQILAAIAALFHDFGKASQAFQAKLTNKSGKKIADAYRHEWVSLRLFQAFVANAKEDADWLARLASLEQEYDGAVENACLKVLLRDGLDAKTYSPFEKMPGVAKAVGWLILTHHRMPNPAKENGCNAKQLKNIFEFISPSWNSACADASEKEKKACWQFKYKLPFSSRHWRVKASYWANEALKRAQLFKLEWVNDGFSLQLARLCLMLADHYYSSQQAQPELGDPNFPLFANTDKEGKLKQRLDEHLVGVAKHTKAIVRRLPLLQQTLPSIARHKGFKRRNADARFRWQDQAYDLACALRERSVEQGFFGINMASTGCGKTLANGRIMYALANPKQGARFAIALGLRTLTLQTGNAYRERLALGEDDLAVLVGSSAVKDLFKLNEARNQTSEADDTSKSHGSESAAPLLSDNNYVHFAGLTSVGPLEKWLHNQQDVKKLLAAPILVCTIDYLIGATEATRGGKQIAPMLRLMTSDLVLDEPDDFDMDDLPALTRLVHWAGMLGSRVLLSSATLPPALIEGLFNAYRAGRTLFQQSRGIPGKAVNICCAWFDEHRVVVSDHTESVSFMQAHQQFIEQRIEKLRQAEIRRRAIIKPLNITAQEPAAIRRQAAEAIHTMLYELHRQHNTVDKTTGKRISFGLIRMANIDPLIDVAQHLLQQDAQANYQVRYCCYHSRHPLLVRSRIEQQLDRWLNRNSDVFADKQLRNIINDSHGDNLIFVVLASPIAEVGRDHDYDWAIVEPSSMRSIIQLAGRVKRHRLEACTIPNMYLLNTNIKSLEKLGPQPTYCKPGFEKADELGHFLLNTHYLEELLTPKQYEIITAEPRISNSANLEPNTRLVDLEHARLQALMLGELEDGEYPVKDWWESQAMLSGVLQSKTPFRYDPQKQVRYALLWDEDEQRLKFFDIEGEAPKAKNGLFPPFEIILGERVQTWGTCDYLMGLSELAEQFEIDLGTCAIRYGWVSLPQDENNEKSWRYNAILGLRRND